MSCARFEIWVVSDEAADRERAAAHARGCPRCAEVLAGQRRLEQRAEAWKREARPPAGLEARLLAAVAAARQAGRPAVARRGARGSRRLSVPAWSALAASLLIAGLGLALAWPRPRAPAKAEHLLVSDALAAAEAAEQQHARAIARLEAVAAPVLASAREPGVDARRAGLLLAYADRLALLDSTIAEVRGFLAGNSGHPGARTLLLAAYREKTQILRQVLALEETS